MKINLKKSNSIQTIAKRKQLLWYLFQAQNITRNQIVNKTLFTTKKSEKKQERERERATINHLFNNNYNEIIEKS